MAASTRLPISPLTWGIGRFILRIGHHIATIGTNRCPAARGGASGAPAIATATGSAPFTINEARDPPALDGPLAALSAARLMPLAFPANLTILTRSLLSRFGYGNEVGGCLGSVKSAARPQ